MNEDSEIERAKVSLDEAIRKFTSDMDLAGAHMPSLATYLRNHADELAERFPYDVSGFPA